jgi:hypothetical protein
VVDVGGDALCEERCEDWVGERSLVEDFFESVEGFVAAGVLRPVIRMCHDAGGLVASDREGHSERVEHSSLLRSRIDHPMIRRLNTP